MNDFGYMDICRTYEVAVSGIADKFCDESVLAAFLSLYIFHGFFWR